MADASDLQFGSGMDAVRVSNDPSDEAHRREKARKARGNLAAILVERAGGLDVVKADGTLVAAEFAELCEALGLDGAPERAPGRCLVCGGPLSSSTMTNPTTAQRQGYCTSGCKRKANLANQPGGER